MKLGKTWALVWPFVAMSMGCGAMDDGAESQAETVASAEQAIINGSAVTSNRFSAAIIRRKSDPAHPGMWGYTSCSGSVLRRTTRATFVLTARHCVTTGGKIEDPLMSTSDFRVTTAIAPGTWVRETDSSAVTRIAAVATSVRDIDKDLALLTVGEPLTLSGDARLAVSAGPTTAYQGGNLSVYGYGRYVAYDNSTVGTLRVGTGFVPGVDYGLSFVHGNVGNNGAVVNAGDSGGAVARYSAFGSAGGWYTLFGVTSTPVTAGMRNPSTAGHWEWLQTQLGYVFISHAPDMSTTLGCATTTPVSGASLATGLTGDAVRNRWTYYPSNGTLRLGGLCAYGNASTVTLRSCVSSNAYRWDLVPTAGYVQLRNRSLGTCLTSATTPGLAACGSSSLRALFHTQP